MDNNTIKFSELMNSYTSPKIGELSINEKALAEYEKFCLDLIKENNKQKEINKKAIEYIKGIDFDYLEETYQNSTKEYLERLLQILEDKEV